LISVLTGCIFCPVFIIHVTKIKVFTYDADKVCFVECFTTLQAGSDFM